MSKFMNRPDVYYARQWLYRAHRWMSHRIYSRFYRDNEPDIANTIMVAGTARSGTTWLARIVSSQFPCRVMFEPFNPKLVHDYAPFNYFQYMRPDETDVQLFTYCQRVFSGAIRDPWIDRAVDTLAPRARLVKEIRANLFLKWIHQNFPEIPLLFLVRHPCAVVQSRLHLNWATDGDIEPFLEQSALLADHLSDKMDIITKATTPAQKHAVIWCISNLIPLRQFAAGELAVFFYEHLCVQPEVEIPRIFDSVARPYKRSVFDLLERPSQTATSDSAVMRGDDRVNRWQSQLSARQIDDVLTIVGAFGLDFLYGDSTEPVVDTQNVVLETEIDALYE